MKVISVLLVLLASSFSFAEPIENLKEFLGQRIIVLDQPYLTFHYRASGREPVDYNELLTMTRAGTTAFYRTDIINDSNMAGPGLYVAVDPVASRTFGGEAPQLFAITIRKGARVLDARSIVDDEVYDKFEKITQELECFEGKDDDSSLKIEALRNSSSLKCQQATIQVLKELNVEAILYPYSATNSLVGCRENRSVAFNLIMPSAIDENGLSFYSPQTKIQNDPGIGDLIAAIYEEGAKDEVLSAYSDKPLSPIVATLARPLSETPKRISELKSQLIWKCGAVKSYDGSDSDAFIKYYTKARKRLDLGSLIIKATAAFNKKFTRTDFTQKWTHFEIRKLRGILRLQYRHSGMAPDDSKFEQWLKAFNSLDGQNVFGRKANTNEILQKAANYLEEKVTLLSDEERKKFIKKVTMDMKKVKKDIFWSSAGFYPDLLRQMGAGPRLASILMSPLFPGPIVIGPIPMDPKRDYSKFMMKNQEYVVKLIKKCMAIYEDPHKSADEISKGECGNIDF